MTTRSSKFLIGLFVIMGVVILAAVIIWVGAARKSARSRKSTWRPITASSK